MMCRGLAEWRLALSLGLALGIAGCGKSDAFGVENGGRVQFVLSAGTDAIVADGGSVLSATAALSEDGDDREHDYEYEHPRPYFESMNVTLTSILARNFEGILIDVAMDLPVTVDVMRMDRGRQITLPDGQLPEGTYDQVVLVMSAVQGVTHDGTTITIEPPGGGWTAIVPVCPFEVEEGGTTVVGLELMLRRSLRWLGDRFMFQPRFMCDQDEEPMEPPAS